MRHALIALSILLGSTNPAIGQVSVGISVPGVSIGIHQPAYPELVLVPGYPVYYAPRLNANYFFYDGMYWVYYGDHWYASTWYNGPWELVDPYYVPLFVLRVPVRYYRAPPVYFRGWYVDAPPRWDHHWGPQWAQQRRGWNQWNRNAAPRPAPLPVYQRQYSGNRYPRAEQQHTLRTQNYRYQPRETVVRQRFQAQAVQQKPAPSQPGPQGGPAATRPQASQQEREQVRRPAPTQGPTQQRSQAIQEEGQPPRPEAGRRAPEPQDSPVAPRARPQQRERENAQKSAPPQAAPQQRGPAAQEQQQPQQGPNQRAQQAPKPPPQAQQQGPQGKGEPQQSKGNPERRQGPGPDRGKDKDKGQGRQ